MMDSQVYLREDGRFTNDPDDSDEVFDLSKAPDELGATYIGNRIRDAAHLREAMPWYEKPSYKAIKEALDLVSLGIGFVDFAISLYEWIDGAEGQADPAMQWLSELHRSMEEIQDFQLASWITSREENLVTLSAYASTALSTAATYMYALTHASDVSLDDPYWGSAMATASRDAEVAVKHLMKPAYWLRPQSMAAISTEGDPVPYPTGWMSQMPDRAADEGFHRVWDHRWALPGLLYAIAARISVLKAFYGPAELHNHPLVVAEVKSYIDYLGGIWLRMDAGIRRGLLRYSDFSPRQRSDFSTAGWVPAFAVDLNGAAWVGGIAFYPNLAKRNLWRWNGPLPPSDIIPSSDGLDMIGWVEKFIWSVSAWSYSHVADAIGMSALMQYIGSLWNIIEPSRRLPFVAWQHSVSEILSAEEEREGIVLAAAISDAAPAARSEERASNAFHVYNSLRSGRGEAAAVVEQCAGDLIRIGRTS
ncbi:hypothetical protein ACF1G0_25950 [Streptomyces sp. NPDC013953]|uniref:hypothetical protein n=1 Tax=Streptomyces sp. NPDC013953 TaxID=3364868 RepID=UPI0036FE50D7